MAKKMESEVEPTFTVLKYPGPWFLNDGPYKAFVFSTFLNSLRHGNPWFKQINSQAYYKSYHSYLEQLLSRHGCTVRIAVLSDDPDVALGWSISRPDILDYVYVKRDGRKQGIGRALLPQSFSIVSHLTSVGEFLKETYFPSVKFDPFS